MGEVSFCNFNGFRMTELRYVDVVVRVALIHKAGAEADFQFLGHLVGDFANLGDVGSDDVATDGDDFGEDGIAFVVDGNVGGAAADVNQYHTVLFFLFGKARHGRGDRLQGDVFDMQSCGVDALQNLVYLALVASDDLEVAANGASQHADGFVGFVFVVDDETLRNDGDNLFTRSHLDALNLVNHVVDFLFLNHVARLFVADDAVFVLETLDMTTSYADEHLAIDVFRFFAGTFQCQIFRGVDAVDGLGDVENEAVLYARGFALAVAKHIYFPTFIFAILSWALSHFFSNIFSSSFKFIFK